MHHRDDRRTQNRKKGEHHPMRRTPICNNEIGSLSNRLRNNCQSVKDDSEVVFKSTAKTP
jgi:hypothetical protein